MKLKTHTLTVIKGRRGAMAFCICRENLGTLKRRAASFYAVEDSPEVAKAELVKIMREYHIPTDCQWREYTDMTIDFYSKSDKELQAWCGAPAERPAWQQQNANRWRTSYQGPGNRQQSGGKYASNNGARRPVNGTERPGEREEDESGIPASIY